MADLNSTSDLTAEENAYFESGGETALPEAPADAGQPAPPAAEGDVPAAGAGQPERDEAGRWVSHGALHAEREEHKKTRGEMQQLRERVTLLDDRWNTLLKLREGAEKPPEVVAPPNPEEDIFGFAKWQGEQLTKLQERLDNGDKQAVQQREIEQQEQGIWSDWQQSVQEYGAATPDFGDAAKFLGDLRFKQIQAFGAMNPRLATAEGANEQVNAELRAIIIECRQAKISPAKFVHDLAVQYGFKAAPQDPNTIKMPEKLVGVAAAQEAARTVGQSSGRAGGDAMTLESIVAMPPAEFDRWAADPKNARLLDKMLGA